jgi:pimeloyl-ACP methyl ester carboxylesterase
VQFQNSKDNFKLSGTLTLPDTIGNYPAVVLITGSGPQERNVDILGHKTFFVLADYLTRNGIAVLRFDDRGTAKSEGTFKGSSCYDFAQDATDALKFIKSQSFIDTTKVGLVGHSEGGNVIAIAAEDNKDVDFLVFLSGPGVSNLEMYRIQLKNIIINAPEEYDYNRDYWYYDSAYTYMATINDLPLLHDKLSNVFDKWVNQFSTGELSVLGNVDEFKKNEIKKYSDVWYREFMKFDVTPYLKKINVPILALGGDKDLQVDSKQNLAGFEKTLKESNHKNYKTIEIKNINHFFQPCTDGNLSENYFNETTFSEEAMKDIVKWIEQL